MKLGANKPGNSAAPICWSDASASSNEFGGVVDDRARLGRSAAVETVAAAVPIKDEMDAPGLVDRVCPAEKTRPSAMLKSKPAMPRVTVVPDSELHRLPRPVQLGILEKIGIVSLGLESCAVESIRLFQSWPQIRRRSG
ncbi:hypothetical protein GGD66_000398 [Bradyrhizobium sp. CIR48]|uniref:hypothetical protein n=1 Tax=unclassified Bradyrhizobium TaxID=2631580 RepID=UPI001606A917|nr:MULTISPECIES: hypothetical protein [unclassified Bradyrhizobium]MBB4391214.1 hypothetical protein [Bradyrhizobium sp. ERR14]MBB4421872.1 hypothetical protein [Bradyrhizobium sp. CIR48]